MNYNAYRTTISIIVLLLISGAVSKLFITYFIELLQEAGCKRRNYRGKEVVFGAGTAFLPVLMVMTSLSMLVFSEHITLYSLYILSICAIGFAGVLDDLLGETHIKGLKNHMRSLIHGHVTTGFIKALTGGFASIIVSINISNGIVDFILNIFVIALFTNTMNLLDLRPGRCVKSFILIGTLIITVNFSSVPLFMPLVFAIVTVSLFFPLDLKELCMLGDTGSNILGMTLGYFTSLNSSLYVKLIILLVLLAVNITAEKVSLTAIISKNKFLNYLDSIGRSS